MAIQDISTKQEMKEWVKYTVGFEGGCDLAQFDNEWEFEKWRDLLEPYISSEEEISHFTYTPGSHIGIRYESTIQYNGLSKHITYQYDTHILNTNEIISCLISDTKAYLSNKKYYSDNPVSVYPLWDGEEELQKWLSIREHGQVKEINMDTYYSKSNKKMFIVYDKTNSFYVYVCLRK